MTTQALDMFATNRWIDGLDVGRACKIVLRAIVAKIDARTGQSHPRFPILQAAIARAIDYSIASVCRALAMLEDRGLVIRRRMRPKRQADGTVRQDPTDYELVLPAECWREVKGTKTTRANAPVVCHDERWSRSVRGSLSEQDATTKHRSKGWDLDKTVDTTFIDETPAAELAPKLLDAAMVASASADESIAHRAKVCLNELRKRAIEVALLACNLNLDSTGALAAVRGWATRCVTNTSQRVDSAEHSMNILRKFMLEQREWALTKGPERVKRMMLAKIERSCQAEDSQRGQTKPSGVVVNRGECRVRDLEPAPSIEVTWEPWDDTDYEPLPYEVDWTRNDDDGA